MKKIYHYLFNNILVRILLYIFICSWRKHRFIDKIDYIPCENGYIGYNRYKMCKICRYSKDNVISIDF